MYVVALDLSLLTSAHPCSALCTSHHISRKEPSAFNRKAAGSPILPLEADYDDVDNFDTVDIINIDAVNETDQCEEDLSKGSYWSVDDTHSFIKTYLRRQSVAHTGIQPSDDHHDEPVPSDRNSYGGNKAITVSTSNASKSHIGSSSRKDNFSGSQAVADTSKSDDPFLGNSTTSIIAQQWSTKQQEVRTELAEFELIEKQLESSGYEAPDRPTAQHAAKDGGSDPHTSSDSRGRHVSTAASSSKQSVSSYLDSCDRSRFGDHDPYPFRPVMLDPVLAVVDCDDSAGVHGSYRGGDGVQADRPIDGPVKWETIAEDTIHDRGQSSSRVFSDSWGKVTQPANHAAESSSLRSADTNSSSSSNSSRMRLSSNTLRKIEARNATLLNHHQVTQQHLHGASDASESHRIQSEDSNTTASSHSTYPQPQPHDDYSSTGPVIRPRPTSAPRSAPTAVGSKQLPEHLLRKSSTSSKDTLNRSGHPGTDEQQVHLASKLRELEVELETYR